MQEEIALVERFERILPTVPKNEVLERTFGERTGIFFVCQVEHLTLWLALFIGKRKGIHEEVYAFDFSRKIVVDRLHFTAVTHIGDGHFFDLPEMRSLVKKGADPYTLCREAMQRKLQNVLANPGRVVTLVSNPSYFILPIPSFFVDGGLPSLPTKR